MTDDPYRKSGKKPTWVCFGATAFRLSDVSIILSRPSGTAQPDKTHVVFLGPDRKEALLTEDQAKKVVAALTDGETVIS